MGWESPTKTKAHQKLVDNEVLQAIVEKIQAIVLDYVEELGLSSTNISRHLKLIGKVLKSG